MDRLTNKREADAQRKEYENRISNGYPRNIPEERFLRLAAYEDALYEAVVGMSESGKANVVYTTLSDQMIFEQADIGKTVFLTHEEAEKTLEAMVDG